ncbi:hypothetical protein [Microvirga flavescens]|uniref:hypothetical protein n=1 Tax=Microvirga flavescens TaxID=2249811 RepID=UPI001300A5F4|nr:hypothetical protein [Microvirga flavescens]
MTPRTTVGSAQNLHLTRTARVAGEAFAFNEPEAVPVAQRASYNLLWIALGLIAAAALYIAF